MPEFAYQDPFPLGPDSTRYRHLTSEYVSVASFEGQDILKVAPEALVALAREAFRVVSFHYRASHLAKVAAILDDPEASPNDRGVALSLLRNAVVAAGGRLPMCQDTGTAIDRRQEGPARLDRRQGRGVARPRDLRDLSDARTCDTRSPSRCPCTRRSTPAPTCRPRSTSRPPTAGRYEFLFVAKGGGSANKSMLFQETRALLNPGEPGEVPRPRSCVRSVRPPARRTISRSSSAAPRPRRR